MKASSVARSGLAGAQPMPATMMAAVAAPRRTALGRVSPVARPDISPPMNRRHFLSRGLGVGALALTSGAALGDAATYQQFHAALEKQPELSVFADTAGALSGTAKVSGRLPADLNGVLFRNGPGRFRRRHHRELAGHSDSLDVARRTARPPGPPVRDDCAKQSPRFTR